MIDRLLGFVPLDRRVPAGIQSSQFLQIMLNTLIRVRIDATHNEKSSPMTSSSSLTHLLNDFCKRLHSAIALGKDQDSAGGMA
jgi:hypothetical protein